jgi:hypothetical protein
MMMDVSGPWPSKHGLDTLVHNSSRYLIYASTALKFVGDEDERPIEQLAAVISRKSTSFSDLDRLYRHILSTVPRTRRDILVWILGRLCSRNIRPSIMEKYLGLPRGETLLTLRRLRSFVEIPDDNSVFIRITHVSFKESLLSPGRAEKFDVDDLPGYLIRHPEKSLADRFSIVRLLCSTASPILLLKFQLVGIARTVNQCMIQNPSRIFFPIFSPLFTGHLHSVAHGDVRAVSYFQLSSGSQVSVSQTAVLVNQKGNMRMWNVDRVRSNGHPSSVYAEGNLMGYFPIPFHVPRSTPEIITQPEYDIQTRLTKSGDVYSLGDIMLQIRFSSVIWISIIR